MMGELTCRQFVEFLDRYLSGEMPGPQRDAFDRHLSECPSCVTYTKTYLEAMRIARLAFNRPGDALPSDVPAELVDAILSARGEGS